MTSSKIIWIWHSTFKKGGAFQDTKPQITRDFISQYLANEDYVILRHSLYKGGCTLITKHSSNGAEKIKCVKWLSPLPDMGRYLAEIFFNIVFFLKNARSAKVYSFDPLCTFVPILLKKIGWVDKVYFFTPDFALKRFSNPFLNKVYFLLDEFCTANCDLNICNSSQVIEAKKRLYKNTPEKIYFLLRNVPLESSVKKYENIPKKKFQIIYASQMADDSLSNFQILFDAIKKLAHTFPLIKLVVVGDGPKKKLIEELAHDHIFFTGLISHEEALKLIAESEIGFAVYDGQNEYDMFRDSLKIREYQAFGVIPITTKVVKSNVEEIIQYNSGVILTDFNVASIIDAIEQLQSRGVQEEMRMNAKANHSAYSSSLSELIKLLEF